MNTTMTPHEKFDLTVSAFLRNMTLRGKSEKTVRNYSSRLRNFRQHWTDAHGGAPENDPDYSDVLSYRDDLLSGGAEPSTVRQYLVELKKFFATVQKPIFGADLCYPVNPVDGDFYPSVKKRPFDQILTDEQILKLLPRTRPTHAKNSTWPRNYAFVALILSTKLRNDEILSLTLDDLHFDEEYITVNHGKGDKYREVDFPYFARSAILLYLQSGIRPATLPSASPLFGTFAEHIAGAGQTEGENWHKGSNTWLSECIRRHVLAVTGVDNVRSHDLRHLGARTDLNAGESMEYIQAQLGHNSMSTTQIYTERLRAKRGRNAARQIVAEMEKEGEKNMALYSLRAPAAAG